MFVHILARRLDRIGRCTPQTHIGTVGYAAGLGPLSGLSSMLGLRIMWLFVGGRSGHRLELRAVRCWALQCCLACVAHPWSSECGCCRRIGVSCCFTGAPWRVPFPAGGIVFFGMLCYVAIYSYAQSWLVRRDRDAHARHSRGGRALACMLVILDATVYAFNALLRVLPHPFPFALPLVVNRASW